MVEVEHEQPCGAHKLGTARAEGLGALLLALRKIGLVARFVERTHIGECRQLGFGVLLPSTVAEDELFGEFALREFHELLCIAGLQHFIK